MSKIKNIKAKEIKDSRGNPTIEVKLESEKGKFFASIPSGASTGKNEALELRDEDGKGVKRAIKNINKIIAPKLENQNPEYQTEIDKSLIELDGTENKSKLGANAILAVSMVVCRAGANAKKIPLYKYIRDLCDSSLRGGNSRRSNLKTVEIASHSLAMTTKFEIPFPMFNILEGGEHVHPVRDDISNGAGNNLAIQEFMIVPQKKTFAENLITGSKVYQNLKEILVKNYGESAITTGDDGGFAPPISATQQALFLLKTASENQEVKIALDCAASQFYKKGKYYLDQKEFTRASLLDFYKELINSFPFISIEDPFDEEDWEGFKELTKEISSEISVIGDDLTTTNIKRIKEAHNKSACNGVILKLNQIGTVSETIEACNLAKSFGWKTIVSHRSGETMDDFIADLSVGIGADFIKSGSPIKEERMVKYSRLLEIEKELRK